MAHPWHVVSVLRLPGVPAIWRGPSPRREIGKIAAQRSAKSDDVAGIADWSVWRAAAS